MRRNILVAQSGGPTAAINATLSGILREAMKSDKIDKVYGGISGIAGILEGKIIRLDSQIGGEEDLELLAATPAMALSSCRYKLPMPEVAPDVYRQLTTLFDRLEIGAFFYIGGNDSMDTVNKLNTYFKRAEEDIRIVGCPKTIDNDLACTDHTPGFGSAAKYVATSLAEVYADSLVYGRPMALVVEIMGRDAGWLTASSGLVHMTGLPAPHFILLPEAPLEIEPFLRQVKEGIERDTVVMVAMSEGVRLSDGSYLQSEEGNSVDAFGHVALSGAGKNLEQLIKRRLGCKTRSIELSLLQRSASHYASATDIEEAVRVGEGAVALALEGQTGVMAAIRRVSNDPYRSEIEPVPIEKAANAVRHFPLEWLNSETGTLTREGIEYFLPLIRGEAKHFTQNSLPRHFRFDREELV